MLKFFGLGTVLSFFSVIFSSWILIHLLTLFGVFLAIAYPLWWLIAPKKTFCIFCRSRKEGEKCPFCGQEVRKVSVHPKNLRSAILNGAAIALFSLFSLGLVFVESKVLFKLGFPTTPKTASFVIPTKGQFQIGEVFPLKIEISGIKTPINTVQADLGFDPEKVELTEISTEGSFATLFIQKEIDNKTGYARLTGGIPNPGYAGTTGLFATALFKGKIAGPVNIEFLPSSMILANDGRGSLVLKDLASVSYLIMPESLAGEARKKKAETSSTPVLGTTPEKTQMIFYEEKQSNVLGEETEVPEKKKTDLSVILDVLEKVDTVILTPWLKIFSLR